MDHSRMRAKSLTRLRVPLSIIRLPSRPQLTGDATPGWPFPRSEIDANQRLRKSSDAIFPGGQNRVPRWPRPSGIKLDALIESLPTNEASSSMFEKCSNLLNGSGFERFDVDNQSCNHSHLNRTRLTGRRQNARKRHHIPLGNPMSDISPEKHRIARQTARMLLEIEAISFNATTPFIFTSGWASPVYTDMRKIIAYPRLRRDLTNLAAETIFAEIGYECLDVIAGGETAGIPFAAWLADRMMLPMQYIRKKPKGFGRNAQIEGVILDEGRALLVEDLATDGRSKVSFCDALRAAGQRCDHAFVFFFYDIFPQARAAMSEIGVTLHYLVTWWDVLEAAKETGHFPATTLEEVEHFLHEPAAWSAAHGGVAEFKPAG
jgi:orotate phosphoribosyltransferase